MSHILSIAKKELRGYFSSAIALIFVGAYLLLTVTYFFSVDGFFARNIADVRPLFDRMPYLMWFFLCSLLTMRAWSEEQKLGTLEVLLTLPVKIHHLVLGKFLGALALVALTLLLTLPIPISVSMMGSLDWGPVIGGYVGALLLAGAYIAVGVCMSSFTSNQITALALTDIVLGVLYFPGLLARADFVDNRTSELLASLGSVTRFESIGRGVIDVRDVVYYVSLTVLFLAINTLAIKSKGWSRGPQTRGIRRNVAMFTGLVAANLFALNIWLAPVGGARLDLTKNQIYSLSNVTKDMVRGLDNPLIVRGYFSEKTHPLLSPLIPQIRDLIEEYGVISGGRVRAEFLDPSESEEMEKEANQAYGIKSFPFRIQNRNEAGVVNSYFSILVKYGDQFEVLSFNDLIEVNATESNVDVRLRNFEYDLTRSIKKVAYGFQTLDAMFADVTDEVEFTAYITEKTLPDNFKKTPEQVRNVLTEIATSAGEKFKWKVVDPDTDGGEALKLELRQKFGFKPMAVSLFSQESFYLHLLLRVGEKYTQVLPSEGMGEADLRKEIIASIKRSTPGFLKRVGLVIPPVPPPQQPQMPGMPPPPQQGPVTRLLRQTLTEDYTIEEVDLTKGRVSGDIDVLVVFGPKDYTPTQAFAVDQYLMRGGSVIVLGGHYELDATAVQQRGLAVKEVTTGLEDALATYGVTVEKKLVLDTQSDSFPVPVVRDLGGLKVQDIRLVKYPFFVDIRRSGMDESSALTAGLDAVTMQWASPVTVGELPGDKEELARKVVTFLSSTDNSWATTDTSAQPDFEKHGELGFPAGSERAAHGLGVAITGRFESAFKGKPNPTWGGGEAKAQKDGRTITESPDNARLVVIGSSNFANDMVLSISRQTGGDRYINNLQLVQNAIDWALEDTDLLSIRATGAFATTLTPMDTAEKSRFRWTNYLVVLGAMLFIGVITVRRRRSRQAISLDPSRRGSSGATPKLGTEAS